MRHRVVLPGHDAFGGDDKLVGSGIGPFVHRDREVVLLSGDEGESLAFPEGVCDSAHRDRNEGIPRGNGLGHDDTAPVIAGTGGDGTCGRFLPGHRHFAGPEVDQGRADGTLENDALLGRGPFRRVEAGSFGQRHPRTGHPVTEFQVDRPLRRSIVQGGAPQEVALLVTAQDSVTTAPGLVLLDLEGHLRHVFRRFGIRIIAVHVDMGRLVFPVQVMVRNPLPRRLVEREAKVVGPVALSRKFRGGCTVPIHHIDADPVSVGKTGVTGTGLIDLVDISGKFDLPGGSRRLRGIPFMHGAGNRREERSCEE